MNYFWVVTREHDNSTHEIPILVYRSWDYAETYANRANLSNDDYYYRVHRVEDAGDG